MCDLEHLGDVPPEMVAITVLSYIHIINWQSLFILFGSFGCYLSGNVLPTQSLTTTTNLPTTEPAVKTTLPTTQTESTTSQQSVPTGNAPYKKGTTGNLIHQYTTSCINRAIPLLPAEIRYAAQDGSSGWKSLPIASITYFFILMTRVPIS